MNANNQALCSSATSQLVIIDIQERLAAAMAEREAVIRHAANLIQGAALLEIPVTVSEQYPRGLGPTEAALSAHLPASTQVFEKSTFAATGADGFRAALEGHGRPQVVVAGMEAHVCVLQTALALHGAGYQVVVAEDAVCSRNPAHAHNALHRLRHAGVTISNSESVLFEWLGDAAHPAFKAVSALIK